MEMDSGRSTISDEAVRNKTGKDWEEWFSILDSAGAAQMSHPQIVAYLANNYQIDPWWQQSVTVTYEKSRGLRQKHEKPDGFQISRSKTFAVPVERLFAAWQQPEEREVWLPGAQLTVRKSTLGKSIRAGWKDYSTLDIYFQPKGSDRWQMTVMHSKLSGAEQAEEMKGYWAAALDRLQQYLAAASE